MPTELLFLSRKSIHEVNISPQHTSFFHMNDIHCNKMFQKKAKFWTIPSPPNQIPSPHRPFFFPKYSSIFDLIIYLNILWVYICIHHIVMVILSTTCVKLRGWKKTAVQRCGPPNRGGCAPRCIFFDFQYFAVRILLDSVRRGDHSERSMSEIEGGHIDGRWAQWSVGAVGGGRWGEAETCA